ncbi:GNAT family N-acetyltransferase [Pseudoalteromonas piscicida]|uniref:GNAT family N-acetyltransferase n=1 Tax=Pseudoalteromonas piscicida TaxID=43662 RepID=A0A2A5JTV7_PSEO7|nr:GNAT family protein [Pseudoalteromonas piscicida]PCK32912.1 GNAT family N-acetyltransferase [Pseudoalteromonas piscicida]
MQLTTERLILRPIVETDWPLWVKLHQLPDVMRYIGDITDETTLREKFNSGLSAGLGQWHKEDNTWLTFIIEEKATGAAIGIHGFLSMWTPFQQAELGFMVDPQYQGKGYAFEASQAIINFALKTCEYHKLIATVTQGNLPSHHLLRKLGFELEGTLKHNYQINGKWVNDEKFGLLKGS